MIKEHTLTKRERERKKKEEKKENEKGRKKKYTDRHGNLYSSFATNRYRCMYVYMIIVFWRVECKCKSIGLHKYYPQI